MSNHAALIHPTVDHTGRHTYPVWVYDTDKPRNSSRLAARYAAVRLINVFPTLAKAEAAIEAEGLPLLNAA